MLFDSHAHLDDRKFDDDRYEIIENLQANGVEGMVNIGCDIESSIKSVELANKYPHVYATVGIHPHEAKTMTPEALMTLRTLSENPKVVAIGEIGLDYYYDHSPRDIQEMAFRLQIKLAKDLKLPIVIHSRDATKATYDILKEEALGHKVLMHCYSDSVEMAREYVKLGFHISLGGTVTFANARMPLEVAKAVPLDHLLIETDSPYLTPVPHRGKRNEPAYVRFVAEKIAQLRVMEVKDLIDATTANTKAFFSIS
ncbi:MAG: TatD family hydrolase [Tissierellia bacterium]|nr:TatD family hydrolase [Tissierellia bacterium]